MKIMGREKLEIPKYKNNQEQSVKL
jgi:hypothetical protein